MQNHNEFLLRYPTIQALTEKKTIESKARPYEEARLCPYTHPRV